MQGYFEIGFSGKKSIFFVSNPLIMNIVKTATTIFLYKRPKERVFRCLGKISLPKCSHTLFSSCISFWQHGRISRFLWNEREFVCPMNIFIAIMLILALLGLLDKMTGGKRGLGADFDHGLATMGGMALSLVGIYCIGITAVQRLSGPVARLAQVLPFDPSLLVGALLAPDLGGYSIAKQMAASPELGLFSGLTIASTLGSLISFVLPVAMSSIKTPDIPAMMRGIVLGVVTLPASAVVGGLMLGLNAGQLVRNCAPILAVCGLLCLFLLKAPAAATRFLSSLGSLMRWLCFSLFALVAAGLFVPKWQIADPALVNEAFVMTGKITIVICGAMVLSHIALTRFSPPMHWLARKLRVNEPAVVGLLLSLATSVSMLPLFDRMDARGKAVNAAFSVSGAFVLGGQMAFVAGLEPSSIVAAYMIAKLVGGLAAVAAAVLTTPAEPES